ncbi:Diaminopimelate epimerase [Blastochloris viridis]|uniref:Diaminopimelate epimerase n=1 Tax=Blastochloris viridis TaxID=1079 RepID=A0A0S4Q834_BLAVI|nr:Diaminopimelate epimerase [Blastochloris viridis]
MADRPFLKMNGAGNAIIVLDLRADPVSIPADEVCAVAARVPFDQMMVLYPPRTPGSDAYVRILNQDGSESGACGNGTRCIADIVFAETGKDALLFETRAGLLPCVRAEGGLITVDMGPPRLRWDEIPLAEPFADTRAIELEIGPRGAPILHSPAVVNMGNPHAIFWVDDVEAVDLARVGPLLECHPLFPERANISLAQVIDRGHIRLKVWERGAGITLACGSAACAAVVAAVRTRRTERKARVSLPGGDLVIEWRHSDDRVLMTGPVEHEFAGRFDPHWFEAAA